MDRGQSRLSEQVHVIHAIFNGLVDPTSGTVGKDTIHVTTGNPI
jgi:hypothetical protein